MLSSIKYITFSFQATLPPYVCKISLRIYKILKLSIAFFLYFELQECGRASFKTSQAFICQLRDLSAEALTTHSCGNSYYCII